MSAALEATSSANSAGARYIEGKRRTVKSLEGAYEKYNRAKADLEAAQRKTLAELKEATLKSEQRRYLRQKRMDIGKASRRKDSDALPLERAFVAIYEAWRRAKYPVSGVRVPRWWLAQKIGTAEKRTHKGKAYSPRAVAAILSTLVGEGHLLRFDEKAGRGRAARFVPADYPLYVHDDDLVETVRDYHDATA